MARNEQSNNQNNQNARRRERREPKPKRKSGILGKILCLLLGFVLGIVGTLGGIVGLGYYTATQVKIKDAVGTVNDLAGMEIDYTQFINEQYGDSSIYGLVETIIGTAGQMQDGTGSLNTLNAISPMVGTSVQSLIASVAEFGISIDYETLMSTPFSALGDFLSATINNTDVARLVESVTKNPVEGVLAMICYGEPGEDYIILEDGTVQMIGTSTSVTIGSLTNAEQLSKRLNGLTFYSLIEALGGDVNTDDPIIRALVYGEENVDYVMNVDGSISPLPKTYQLNSDEQSMVFTSPNDVEFGYVGDGVWKDENDNVIQQTSDGSTYQYEVFDSNQTPIGSLKFLSADGDLQYYQVYVSDVAQTRKGPYVSDILGENANLLAVVGGVPLGDILRLNGSSDPILLAIAYGEEGTDYVIGTNNRIIPINSPITLNKLIEDGNGMNILRNISLGTLLAIESPMQKDADPLLIPLVFGEEGVCYELIDTNGDGIDDDWRWLKDENGEYYTQNTLGDLLDGKGNSLFDNITVETLMNVSAASAPVIRALAYGNEYTHYVLIDADPNDSDPTRDFVKMLPKRYYVTDNTVYDEEHIFIGVMIEEVESGIFSVRVGEDKTEYIKENPNGGYDVFHLLENAQNYTADNDTRQYHSKTKMSDLRGYLSRTFIERIELSAALDLDIFDDEFTAENPLMVQIAYGTEGIHYTLDRENKQIIWLKDNDPNSETYGLYHHARTIHDMKDTHTLLQAVYLDTVLELTYESPDFMLALAYGNDYEIIGNTISYDPSSRRTIGDLMGANSNDLIKGIELRKIIKSDENNDARMNFILYNMTQPDENDPNYKVRTLGELMDDSSKIIDDMINVLTVSEALGDEATAEGILSHMKDVRLCDFSAKIQTISIQTVMDESPENSIYSYAEIDGKLVTAVQVTEGAELVWKEVVYTDHAENNTRTWTFAESGEVAPSPLKGTWKYLLKDSSETEYLYALANMNDAMNNISSNVNDATLYDLHNDGLIKFETEAQGNILYKPIVKEIAGQTFYTGEKEKLGELTVAEMIDYLALLLAAIAYI